MKKLQTINLKGKDYVQVNVRIQAFREDEKYKGWSIDSDILTQTDKMVTMKAVIKNAEGVIVASGHATEYSNAQNPKITENCETSAWGRALGNLGIGIDESIASAEEMDSFHNTKPTQSSKQTAQPTGEAICPQCSQSASKLEGKYGPYIKCENCHKNFSIK